MAVRSHSAETTKLGNAFPGTVVPVAVAKDSSGDVATLNLDSSGNLLVSSGGGGSSNPAAGPTGSAVPADADYQGINVAGDLQGATGFDLDTSGVTHEYDQGVSVRLPASGGSVAGATLLNPLRVDPTGTTTQPVSVQPSSSIAASGQVTVNPTAALLPAQACRRALIQSSYTNTTATLVIYVGTSGGEKWEMVAGDSLTLNVSNLDEISVKCTAALTAALNYIAEAA
jgi:hypothetical protein